MGRAGVIRGGVRKLAAREMEALRWAAEGLTNEQIAAVMGITPNTAKAHIARAIEATGANNRTHAVVLSGAWRP